MIKNKLPKKFSDQFPKAAKVAARNDANIKWRDKSFWLDGRVQLTGFEIDGDGKRMTTADNDDVAAKRLTQWEEGRRELQNESLFVRFERLMAEAIKLPRQFHCFSVYRHPGGDEASVFSDGSQVAVSMVGIEKCIYGKGKDVAECVANCRRAFENWVGGQDRNGGAN